MRPHCGSQNRVHAFMGLAAEGVYGTGARGRPHLPNDFENPCIGHEAKAIQKQASSAVDSANEQGTEDSCRRFPTHPDQCGLTDMIAGATRVAVSGRR